MTAIPSGLEPVFKERIDFTFPELFDADDPLAPWLINLARGANDLLLGNRRLLEDLDASPSENPTPRNHAVIYDVKAVASDAWELAKFIRENQDSPQIAEFVGERIPEEAHKDLQDLLACFGETDDDPPDKKQFKKLLASARDQDSHYSEVDHKLMKRALRNLRRDFEGRPNETSLLEGETFKDFYAPFGTEMDWQLFHELGESQWDSFKRFVFELNELVGRLVRFAATAIDCWFRDHESATRRVKLAP